jgi:hypothetical protein
MDHRLVYVQWRREAPLQHVAVLLTGSQSPHDTATTKLDDVIVTSLKLCECESEGFQKLELKLSDNETNKDAFFSSPLKS